MDLILTVNLIDENDVIVFTKEATIPQFYRSMNKVAREVTRIESEGRVSIPDDWKTITVVMKKV